MDGCVDSAFSAARVVLCEQLDDRFSVVPARSTILLLGLEEK